MLACLRCDLTSINHAMEQPLYIAALRGHAECLKLLLDSPLPKVSAKAYHDGYTPVHAAVIGRSLPCLKMLLDARFDPDTPNRFMQTPLHLAARLGTEDMLQACNHANHAIMRSCNHAECCPAMGA